MINLVAPILGLINKIIGPIFFMFTGKKIEENKNLKENNEALKDTLGRDDDELARKLRERGNNKQNSHKR